MSIKLSTQAKAFLISFALVFVMVLIPKLKPNNVKVSTESPVKVDRFDQIIPKLQQKINNFQLKKQSSLISTAHAGASFDNAKAYALIDYDTGEVLASSNFSDRLPIASITKTMTAIVAIDLAEPNEQFIVSEYASKIPPTKIGVAPGQKMSLEELLHALLLTSANDSAQVIKEGIDKKYDGDYFIRAMNAKAQFLGLQNTSFDNPQGFDGEKNFSSAEDLSVLSRYALENYPLIAEIVKKDYHFIPANSDHKQFDLYNWNGLLGTYPGATGLKIGNTEKAGVTTAVVAEREGKKLIAVLLGAPGVLERDLWTAELLDFGFQKGANLQPVVLTELQLKEKYSTWKYW
ncbi:hypothetical protein A2688_04625 [Candidatus Daviesbacteria bacterium RIFCSPHIGHO2_01_FULL_38_8]|nr:MAG: hypothetical protein A2688_04625 [Candidatus Daviesbacteria bacterium RIFCSPHIGHO2_01_FULL_38_8]